MEQHISTKHCAEDLEKKCDMVLIKEKAHGFIAESRLAH